MDMANQAPDARCFTTYIEHFPLFTKFSLRGEESWPWQNKTGQKDVDAYEKIANSLCKGRVLAMAKQAWAQPVDLNSAMPRLASLGP